MDFNAISGLLAPAPSSSDKSAEESAKSDEKAKIWNVRSGLFAVKIGCAFPVSSLLVDDRAIEITNQTPLYAKPMKTAESISSELHVRVFKKRFLGEHGDLDTAYEKVPWDVEFSKKALAKGYWEQCKLFSVNNLVPCA